MNENDTPDVQSGAPDAGAAPETPEIEPSGESGGSEGAGKPAEDTVDLFGDKPGVKWIEDLDEQGDVPAFRVDRQRLEQLPPEAKQVVYNLRRDYTQKTQAIAAERKQLAAEKAEIQRARVELQRGQAAVLELFGDEGLRKTAAPPPEPDGGPPPLHTEEGLRYAIQKMLAEGLGKHLDGYKEVAEKKKAEIGAAEQAERTAARRGEIQRFVEAHPDFDDHRSDVAALVQKYKMPVEEAYELVVAKKGAVALDPVAAARAGARQAIGGPRSRGNQPAEPPKGLSAAELYDWYEANPEAAAAVRRRAGMR